MKISFEDLTGVAYDVPDLRLAGQHLYHTCQFCEFAKTERQSHQDCIRNKRVVNRVALRRLSGFSGQCHLGLTDFVEPLIYKGRVLGVFYYGSVVVQGTEAEARRRIARYCERRNLSPDPYLAQLKEVPRIRQKESVAARDRLRLVTQFAERLLDAYGLPLERYKTEMWVHNMNLRRKLPPIVQAAIQYIQKHYSEIIRLDAVAAFARCNPDYLGRLFKRNMFCGIEEYTARVRVDHARLLLETSRYGLGEVGFLVGFQDQTHFGRVFKRLSGLTPGEYRTQHVSQMADNGAKPAVQYPPVVRRQGAPKSV